MQKAGVGSQGSEAREIKTGNQGPEEMGRAVVLAVAKPAIVKGGRHLPLDPRETEVYLARRQKAKDAIRRRH